MNLRAAAPWCVTAIGMLAIYFQLIAASPSPSADEPSVTGAPPLALNVLDPHDTSCGPLDEPAADPPTGPSVAGDLMDWGINPAGSDAPEHPEGEVTIHVDTYSLTLTLNIDGNPHATYPIAIGRWSEPTPVGEFVVVNKIIAPGGPFGSAWLGLSVQWGAYGIHGTSAPGSIGTAASAGCIRMYNDHVLELYDTVPVGTLVIIEGREVGSPISRPLYKGDAGPQVQTLQLRLRDQGLYDGIIDGHFDEDVEEAVRRFQRYYDVPVTGYVGVDELHLLGQR